MFGWRPAKVSDTDVSFAVARRRESGLAAGHRGRPAGVDDDGEIHGREPGAYGCDWCSRYAQV